MAYAETTTVPVIKTRAEIEGMLRARKCDQFMVFSDHENFRASVQFKTNNRVVRFTIALPNPEDQKFTHIDRWRRRAASAAQKMVEQAERQRWRALLLVIKAKLESVDSNIATFEQEFLANIVLPNDMTVGEIVIPKIEEAYAGRPLLEAHH